MINKVVYLGYVSLTDKLKEDFFFSEVRRNKIEVEYWDLSCIFYGDNNCNKSSDLDLICISSFKDFKLRLNDLDLNATFFVSTMSYSYRTIYLYYLLLKYDCKVSFFARGALPPINYTKRYVLGKLVDIKSYPFYISQIVKSKIALVLKRLGRVKVYDTIYFAGKKSLEGFCVGYEMDVSKANIVELNYFDFDKTLKIKEDKRSIGRKYCVFHDEYLPFHPDFEINKTLTVDPTNYYIDLNRFFAEIENTLKIQVIIAAHPKAINYETINPFGSRKLVFNKTAELCKYSEFSMLHASTSVSYPIIYKKPIIFLTSDSIMKVMFSYSKWIENFARELGLSPININEYDPKVLNELICNFDLYAKYTSHYLSSMDSDSSLSADIFVNSLSNI
mgnify:CR=1 FL=1|tara:strand:+ start:995 stop:2164 length:1170 start_codon:yes stop_codon:yes gene_type:complete